MGQKRTLRTPCDVRFTPESRQSSRGHGMSALCQKRPHAPQQTACTGCNDLVGHFVHGCAEPRALAVLRLTAKSNLVERIPPGRLASHCLPLRRAGCGNRAGNAMTPLPLRQRARRAIWGLIGLVLFAASAGRAQDYPNRTVTIEGGLRGGRAFIAQ